MLTIEAREETWPLKDVFRISRGSRIETRVVVVTVSQGEHVGRGEGVPIVRYNQTIDSVLAEIESIKSVRNLDRDKLQQLLPAGAARNALDCALWDLEAKISGKRVWESAEFQGARCSRRPAGDARASHSKAATGVFLEEVETSFTISLDKPEKMRAAAAKNASAPILKLKLGGDALDLARVEAVRAAAPAARLFVDANESWSPEHYQAMVSPFKELRVELIEQPFPATADHVLVTLPHPIAVCADESCHVSGDLPQVKDGYEVINVKLDKTGGLTEALHLCTSAREKGLKLLVGCMVGTSLSMAPARVLGSIVDYVDLDGPLLLARDRDNGLIYRNGKIDMPARELWG